MDTDYGGNVQGVYFSGNIIKEGAPTEPTGRREIQIGLRSHADYYNYIFNNLIYNPFPTDVYGIYIYADANSNSAGTKVAIYNNTIINAQYGIVDWMPGATDFRLKIKNNLIFDRSGVDDIDVNLAANGTSTNNAFSTWGDDDPTANRVDLTGVASTTIFADPANRDYRLKVGSPAINQGANLSADSVLAFNYDLQNQTRTGAWDIGADEYSSSTPSDITPPVISNIATSTSATMATITWSTNEAATSTVRYGLTTSYGSASSSNIFASSSHSIKLKNLVPNTTYHFQVGSTDASGNRATTSNHTLRTLSNNTLGLHAASVEWLDATHVRVTYDWTTADQLLDWTPTANVTLTRGTSTVAISGGNGGVCGMKWIHPIAASKIKAHALPETETHSIAIYTNLSTTTWSGSDWNTSPLLGTWWYTSSGYAPNGGVWFIQNGSDYIESRTSLSDNWYDFEFNISNTLLQSSSTFDNYVYSRSGSYVPVTTGVVALGAYEGASSWGTVVIEGEIASSSDITPPVISSVATSTTANSAIITWSTNEAATSTVRYGLSSAYGSSSSSNIFATSSHSIVLHGLASGMTYHFQIGSTDASGNRATSSDKTFITTVGSLNNIYYSVGQNTSDHKTGSPHITISGGVATFDVAQTATNMGVGDKISYDNAGATTTVYISARQSQTVWDVITKTGGQPMATTSATVLKISHAFSSLSAALPSGAGGAKGPAYLNTTDLVTGNYILNIPCYYDSGPDTVAVVIANWTTGPNNYLKIYTPNNTTTEVNLSQRHWGKWNNNKYRLEVTDDFALQISVAYVKIDGLQVKAITSSNTDGISRENGPAGTAWISNNIIWGVLSANTYSDGICGHNQDANGRLYAWNNIIYGYLYDTGNINQGGIYCDAGYCNAYNNTVYGSNIGFVHNGGAYTVKNNISYNNQTGYGVWGGAFAASSTNNLSGPSQTDAPGSNPRNAVTVSFVNASSSNLHLSTGDAGAKDHGVNLSSNPDISFNTDIDGQTRTGTWDIGADEYVPLNISAVTTNTTDTTATITWETDRAATSSVNYGLTAGYGMSSSSSAFVTSHSITFRNLSPGTTYHYQIASTDIFGVTVTYLDGVIYTSDGAPLIISNIATSTAGTTATITWATNKNATSTVRYGLTSSYGLASSSNIFATSSHSIALRGLTSGTTYHFQIISTHNPSNRATSSDYVFHTSDITPPVISNIATSTTQTTATITWSTNEAATSTVRYGLSSAYGSASSSNIFATSSHSVIIRGLTASTTYHFRVESTDVSGNRATTSDHIFRAAINTYILTYAAGANGSLTGSSSQVVNSRSSGSAVNAVPNSGYHFVNWNDASTANPRTDTNVSGNLSVTANFAINTYTIFASAGANGTVTPAATTTKNYGASQTYTIATSTAGYHIADVLVDSVSVGAVSSYTFTGIAANHTISATFAINIYVITASAGAHGTVTPAGVTTKNYGTSQTYNIATSTAGYHVVNILVDSVSIGTSSLSYTFNNIQANHTISAAFSNGITYTVGGTISGLSGTVVLQNNSGDDLSVSSAGSFAFITTLADGASYAVTVLTNPSGQTCSASSGAGNVAGANITNISISCSNNSNGGNGNGGGGGGGSGSGGSLMLADNNPPGIPGSFYATTSGAQIILSWKNPTDSDFAGVRICRKINSAPTNQTDAYTKLIYQGKAQSFTDASTTLNQLYYYSIYSYDARPNYSAPKTVFVYISAIKQTVTSTKPTITTPTTTGGGNQTPSTNGSIASSNPIDLTGISNPITEQIIADEASTLLAEAKRVNLPPAEKVIYLKAIALVKKPVSEKEKILIAYFIHVGAPTTKWLGAGEREGVIASFQTAYGYLPEKLADWQNLLRIANGHWPRMQSKEAERLAKASFRSIYGRSVNPKKINDNAAITIMAYGLRPTVRNMVSEKAAIKTYFKAFHRNPTTVRAWDAVRAIAYSGAKK